MKKYLFKYLIALILVSPLLSNGQTTADIDGQKLQSLAVAISHAEGFGIRHAIPTRYHNPGDLKSRRDLHKLPGQKKLGKGDHVVFANDAAGWAALRDYVSKMVDGRSRRFRPSMTITQVAKQYAGRWRPWVKIVTTELDVEPDTTIAELLLVDGPPSVTNVTMDAKLPQFPDHDPVMPVLVQD